MNETELNTIVVNCKLETLKTRRSVTFSTKGTSMAPFIRNGDRIVLTDCDRSKLKPGDIIAFRTNNSDKIIAHRVIKKERGESDNLFMTKGDSLPINDKPSLTENNIIGKVTEIQKPRFKISLNSFPGKALNLCMLALSVSRITHLTRTAYIIIRRR